MTDPSQPHSGPPPSYEEVQAMSGGAPYPVQQPFPQNEGFKYGFQGYGVGPYPTQQGAGQMPYPQQQYPSQGSPYSYPYGAPGPGQPPPPPPGCAAYSPQNGVVLNGRNTLLGSTELQRRRRIFMFVFLFVAISLFIYFLTRFLL